MKNMKEKKFENNSKILFLCVRVASQFESRTFTNFFLFSKILGVQAHYFDTGIGNKGLLINNYVYKRHYASNRTIYWQCTLCRRLKCRARATTKLDDPSTVVIKCGEHNHTLEDYKKIPKEMDSADDVKQEDLWTFIQAWLASMNFEPICKI